MDLLWKHWKLLNTKPKSLETSGVKASFQKQQRNITAFHSTLFLVASITLSLRAELMATRPLSLNLPRLRKGTRNSKIAYGNPFSRRIAVNILGTGYLPRNCTLSSF